MLELMVVVAIVAVAAGTVSLALRDPTAQQLERDAQRLAALLESARAQARVAGVPVQWVPRRPGDSPGADAADFRFVGLPASTPMPTQWLTPGVRARIDHRGGPAAVVWLGPEPMIPAQRIVLYLDERQVALWTDGLRAFDFEDAR